MAERLAKIVTLREEENRIARVLRDEEPSTPKAIVGET